MTRLLHVLNLNVIGGVERSFAEYVQHPDSFAAFEHFVLTGNESHPYLRDRVQGAAKRIYSRKRLGPMRLPRQPSLLRRYNVKRIVDNLEPDLIVVWNQLRDPLLREAAVSRSVPIIYCERGAVWSVETRSVSETVLAQTSFAICNSNASRRLLELRLGYEGSVRVIHNGLRTAVAPSAPPDRSLPTDRPLRLGLAGRLKSFKGWPIALHAMKHVAAPGLAVELHIAGKGPDEQAIRTLAHHLGIESQLIMHGLIDDMGAFYRAMDVFLCPSIREPFGLVSIEAASWGCPVLAAAVDGLPETIRDGESGLCIKPTLSTEQYRELGVIGDDLPEYVYDPASDALAPPRAVAPEDLALAILKTIADENAYAMMAEQAHTFATTTFHFDRYVCAMNNAIRNACAGAH